MTKRSQMKQLLNQINNWRVILVIAPTIGGLILVIRMLGLLQMLEWAAFDQWFRLRPLEKVDDRIVIITIDEATIRSVGQWPLPDAAFAKVLDRIRQQKPRAIGWDIYRDLPVEPGHQELVKILNSTPNLIGVQKVVGDDVGSEIKANPVLQKRDQVAASDLILDADGKVRRGLISLENQSGQVVLSLGARLSLIYLEAQGIQLQQLETDSTPPHYQLGKAKFVPFRENDGGYVDADDQGYQILLNYRGREN